jgi:probable F420-dependent oxidoreductase
MKYGIEIVTFGSYADPLRLMQFAQAAEAAGWEALWVWDHLNVPYGVCDPWVALSAAAAVTSRIKLVTGVAVLPRYRPQVLARTLASLDQLSNGRLVLGAGLGGQESEFEVYGESGDARTRAEKLDESLAVITGLLRGETFSHRGKHYTIQSAVQIPGALQQPRLPIWIGGSSRAALRRAARWDGLMLGTVNEMSEIILTPAQLAAHLEFVRGCRETDAPFETAVDGITPPGGGAAHVLSYAQAGASWWFEVLHDMRGTPEEMLARINAGPPA